MSDTYPLSRRHFLAGMSTLLAAEAASAGAAPSKDVSARGPAPSRIGPDPQILENEAMRVEVDRATGLFRLIDKAAGQAWEPDPWLGTPGVLVLEKPGARRVELPLNQAEQISVQRVGEGRIEIVFRRLRTATGDAALEAQVKTRLSLVPGRGPLKVEVLAVDCPAGWNMVELEYPCRLGALKTDVDEGYLVVPYLQGCVVPSTVQKWKELPKFKMWSWDDGSWMEHGGADLRIYGWHVISMPWFGAVQGQSALAAIIETENDASLRLVLNSNNQHVFSQTGRLSPYQRVAVTSPLWLAQRKQWGYPRAMLYRFLPGGDYVTLAKHYRRYAAEHGLLVTLREKIERTPALDTIIGGPWVHLGGGYPYYIDDPLYRYTWKDAAKFVDDLADYVGARRALLTLWIGYQHLPPDSWPFHPAQGTLEDLRAMVAHARKRNVLVNFYHGYPTLLESDPTADIARARRSNLEGSMTQRWGRHCPTFYPAYVKKNLPPTIRDSGIVCDYSDILTAAGIGECWDSRHPLTRTEDRRLREETMRCVTGLGLFSGSEWPTGYAMPFLSYFRNGGAGAGSHWLLSQFPVPLFNLVFKDCALMYGPYFPQPNADMMRDLAAGCHYQITLPDLKSYYRPGFHESREGARASVPLFHDWLRATGTAELVGHQFVHELNGPYRTRFSDGSEALANLTTEIRQFDSQTLQPNSLQLRLAGGRTITVTPRTGWNVERS